MDSGAFQSYWISERESKYLEIVKKIIEETASELLELNQPVTSDEAHAPTH